MNNKIYDEFLSVLQENKTDKATNLNREVVNIFIKDIKQLLLLDYLFPNYTTEDYHNLFATISEELRHLFVLTNSEDPDKEMNSYLNELKKIRYLLIGSAKAIFDGDPASDSLQEIILAYPGFQAILYYRIAHEFYVRKKFFLARIISEEAHRLYGIDINPGCTIGENFFIDHGTGIVIGETAIIGDNVKLYQGVTLGALSLKKGHNLKGNKRHPTIEDNVTIYSNASIFGGNTIIGKGSVIGANTYLISSVAPNTKVTLNHNKMTLIKE